ncbi:MAG TPA: TaqI-like C-terminal specificity domain-containing protein [Candidatus Dormibacteraeota bacterium]|nr:TaqI-like C-terminal specificity domain-containing protein [Candidatus Dormibacteraeota bacterium]
MVYTLDLGILSDNLFGVDYDNQAAEIASVNLMLKALKREEKLPQVLGQNIRVGNSIVFGSDVELKSMLGRDFKDLKPFDWSASSGLGQFDVVVGNPPWGADIQNLAPFLEKEFDLAKGQYDSFEIFIELSKRILSEDGTWAFVIPDSIFLPEHVRLRRFLATETTIDRIVKLGEGFFEGVFRASVILVFRKRQPPPDHAVRVFTLMKEDRSKILSAEKDINLESIEAEKGFFVPQKRFQIEPDYLFDIYSTDEDIRIRALMESATATWDDVVESSRGVEFSESGLVIRCPNCFRWNTPPEKKKGVYEKKDCQNCGFEFEFDKAIGKDIIVTDSPREGGSSRPFVRGDGVNRYYLDSPKYIDITKDGINYKDEQLYRGPKLLIRKTGVGIYATIDNSDAYVPQVVFIFKPVRDSNKAMRLEYILGLLNSRLMLYYYYKKFGEVEWKSFPYMTPRTIRQLPLHRIDFGNPRDVELHDKIVEKVKEALSCGQKLPRDLDYEIESLVMDAYGITEAKDREHVWEELGKVQKLRIIRDLMGSETRTPHESGTSS